MDGSRSLFVYGTLLCRDRLHSVTGRDFRQSPALLLGYERIHGRARYPYITPRAEGGVSGAVLFDVDPVSLGRLDRYEVEGVLYFRRSVQVLCDRRRLDCETYVGNPQALEATLSE